jgi:hypothetical protein
MVYPMQPRALDPARNRVPAQPNRHELAIRHHTVLPGRQVRQPQIRMWAD